jgi:hypothetical protein
MEGDGIWARCSRCQHVFFKENPQKKLPYEQADQDSRVEGGQGGPFQDMRSSKPYETPKYFDDMETENEAEEDLYEGKVYGGRPREGIGKRMAKLAAYALLAILILIILAIWTFPQIGEKFFQGLSDTQDYIRTLTGQYNNGSDQFNLSQMQIQDVRQRYINNLLVGRIRIIEGTVLNPSKYYISNIKVRGEILNASGIIVAQKESYCGNLLTDEELIIKTEDEMFQGLSNPSGSDVSNEKVAPDGQIPFMILLIREPAGVVKTIVTLTGAERLLP